METMVNKTGFDILITETNALLGKRSVSMRITGNSLYYSSMMEKLKLSRKFVVALLGQRYLSRKGRKTNVGLTKMGVYPETAESNGNVGSSRVE